MARQVAILHGWSDNSESFEPLAAFLKRNGYRTVPVFLGDYISLRDDVMIGDVAKCMEEVVRRKMARKRLAGPFDLIVHSTGGLVARKWISDHYAADPAACPVRNLVMLAPANFGSKLAHKGRSMLGRIVKGWRTGFETGDEMLYALELSSSFQWDLAQSDLFVSPGSAGGRPFYGPDSVRPFVIVGTHPYTSAVAKITNEDGSDGTVRVAAANLNAYGRTIDFSGAPERLLVPRVIEWPKRGGKGNLFTLAVLPDRDHGNIVRPDKRGPSLETRTLAGEGADAQRHRNVTFRKRDTRRELFHEYFQVCVRVEDEFGNEVPDYFLSFMPRTRKHWYSLKASLPPEGVYFHDEVLESTHVHRRSGANRCLFLDRFDMMKSGGFYDRVGADKKKELTFTVTAADPGDHIAYFSRKASQRQGLVPLHKHGAPAQRWLRRHSTHFLKIIVPRAADPDVFRLRRG